jgi:hypothetical protein
MTDELQVREDAPVVYLTGERIRCGNGLLLRLSRRVKAGEERLGRMRGR